MSEIVTIPARRGKAALLSEGAHVRVMNTHGSQVVDTWAFATEDLAEFMSMEHSRPGFMNLRPRVGSQFLTNRRRPILSFLEDTSLGDHDTLMASCDQERYALLGVEDYHDNCTDNLHAALAELGLSTSHTPAPLNLFMNIPWQADGTLSWEEPTTKPGDSVLFLAEMDLVVVFSACPQDILPINGRRGQPTEAHFQVLN